MGIGSLRTEYDDLNTKMCALEKTSCWNKGNKWNEEVESFGQSLQNLIKRVDKVRDEILKNDLSLLRDRFFELNSTAHCQGRLLGLAAYVAALGCVLIGLKL